MASTSDEGPVFDTAMEQDEDMAQGKLDEPKATYKSFKYVAFGVELQFSTSVTHCHQRKPNQERHP
jgi:hypothetical protein